MAAAVGILAVGLTHGAATALAFGTLSPFSLALNAALLAIELLLVAFAALLFASLRTPTLPAPGDGTRGRVAVLIPVRNEDADVLRATLAAARAIRAQDGFEIIVVDDSDPDARAAIAEACAHAGARHLARPERRGYKAGALNDAMRCTDAPLVAVLDVDHVPEPDFLERALPHLAPGVAYAQSIVEWRNADSLLRRLAALLQRQFYYGVQIDKGSRERAVFTGSAAVFRREAIDSVGGFPEETLVEDFDVTMQLCAAGWRGRLVPHVGARGLLPWTARDLARQLWRWSHGTTEAVRLRARSMLASERAPLLPRIELLADGSAYVGGGLIVAAALLLILAGVLGAPIVRPLGGWALLLAPAAIAAAHVTSAAQALPRAGVRAHALLPLYHVVSLAFTPVLLVGSMLALIGLGQRAEGRVSKVPSATPSRGLLVGVGAAVALALLGLFAASSTDLTPAAAGWVGFLGLCFASAAVAASPGPARSGGP